MAKRIKDEKQNWHYHFLQADPGQSCTVTSKLLGTGMPDIQDKHGMTTYKDSSNTMKETVVVWWWQ